MGRREDDDGEDEGVSGWGDEDARIERIKSKRESRLTETNDPASGRTTDDADSEKFVSQRRARAGRVQIDGCVEHSNVHH